MPWVAEQKEEEKKRQAAQKTAHGKNSAATQKSISAFFKPKPGQQKKSVKEKEDSDAEMQEEEKKEDTRFDEDQKLALLSKVVKSGCVETFNWEFTDRKFVNGKTSDVTVSRKVQDIQAILINPKWAEHGYDTFSSTTTASQNSAENTGSIKQNRQAKAALKPQQAQKSDFEEQRSAYSGLRIEQLKKLVIPPEVMKEGMLFIWAEKELISEILDHFEPQGFEYVENMVYVMLDSEMRQRKCKLDQALTRSTLVIESKKYLHQNNELLC